MPSEHQRRAFLRMLMTSAVGLPLFGACRKDAPPDAQPEFGDPLESLKVRGYQGLAELPYFETDASGELRLLVDDLPPGVDFHAHLAMNFMLSPELDWHRRTDRVKYFIDCDAQQPPCVLDLDVYMNKIASPEMLEEQEREIRGMGLFGSEIAETHTIPNLLHEMDAMRVEKAVLLALKMGLPFRDDLSSRWLNAVKEAGAENRMILFGSVQPKDADAPEELRMLKKEFDIIGVKLHPTMQQFAPDDPRAMELYEICEELDLMVFFHAGRAGIEPPFTQDYALLQNYVGAVSTFPNVPFVFGHAGARDYKEAIAVAKAHANVWMELHGQGVSSIRQMVAELGPEQLLFGTDWPWYPISASLAKLLIVTEGDKTVRNMIFRENALRLLGRF